MKSINYISMKYSVDRPLASLLLVLAVPFMLIFAVIVSIELKAFPFIIQERGLTFDNSRLKVYKFRTIRKHSSSILSNVRNIFEKHSLDSYVPAFCRLLRQTGLDELPQLINVIKGEMSLVGPRPLTLPDLEIIETEDVNLYDTMNNLTTKPGITGYWQVNGSRSQGAANMVWLQDYYERNVSFLLDVKIILSTMPLIFLGQHTDTITVNELSKSRAALVNSLSHG